MKKTDIKPESEKNPAAVALGSIKSDTKSKKARENGKLGGRPKTRISAPPPTEPK